MAMIENPIIKNCEATGYPHGEPEYPICPCCGEECETIYKNKLGSIIGCDICVEEFDAWYVGDCFKGE